ASRPVDGTERADAIRRRAPYEALRTAQVGAGQLLNALALLGALALALRRRTPPPLRRLALLGAATLGVLALVRLSGTAGNAYNQERAFVQTMVPLGIALGWDLPVAALARSVSA